MESIGNGMRAIYEACQSGMIDCSAPWWEPYAFYGLVGLVCACAIVMVVMIVTTGGLCASPTAPRRPAFPEKDHSI